MTYYSASRLRNFLAKQPLLDWLDRFGPEKGFIRDLDLPGYDPNIEFVEFNFRQGREFEARVMELIGEKVDIVHAMRSGTNADEDLEWTKRQMDQGVEAIAQGLVRSDRLRIFGHPDLIIRGDALARVICTMPVEIPPDRYVVVDIKFKSLELNKRGDMSSKHAKEATQVIAYEHGLREMLGEAVGPAFILGRGLKSAEESGCFDHLGFVDASDPSRIAKIDEAVAWLDELEANGRDWDPYLPSDPRLLVGGGLKQDYPWHQAVKEIAERQAPGDPNAGITPACFEKNREGWCEPAPFEFFVDYETVSNLHDDFSLLPAQSGRAMIFMIGCGHRENGDFAFRVFTAEEETYEAERAMIQAWLAHMDEVVSRLAPGVRPRLFHWAEHEVTEIRRATERYTDLPLADLDWYNLFAKMARDNGAKFGNARGLGLKPISRELHRMGHIRTLWGDSAVAGGLAATTAAWHVYDRARAERISIRDVLDGSGRSLMAQIEEYNRVDCQVMQEILDYCRRCH